MHVEFLPYPHHTCWYKYFMKGRGMRILLIGVRYKCIEMMLGGHLAKSYWDKWSINRGGKWRENSHLATPSSSFHFQLQKSPPFFSFAAGQSNSSSTIFFPSIFFIHSLSLSLSHSLTTSSLPSFILKAFLYLYYLLQRPIKTWNSGDLTSHLRDNSWRHGWLR